MEHLAPNQTGGVLDVVGVPDPEFTHTVGSSSTNYPSGVESVEAANAGFSIAEVDNTSIWWGFPQ